MAWCSSVTARVEQERVDREGMLGTAAAWTHPHMPRRRKSARPLLASGGRTSPSPAARNSSYRSATVGDGAVSSAPSFGSTR